MSKSLYSIKEEYLQIIADVEEADGEISEQLINSLAINEKDLEQKCKGYHYVMELLVGLNDSVQKEMNRLQEIKDVRNRGIERLHKNLLQALLLFGEEDKKTGIKRLKYDTLQLYTRRSKGGVVIEDLEKVETKFCNFSLNIAKLSQEIQEKILEFIDDQIISDIKWQNVKSKKGTFPDKKSLKAEIERVEELNKASIIVAKQKWIEEGNVLEDFKYQGEIREVPGAYIAEDKFSLVIK